MSPKYHGEKPPVDAPQPVAPEPTVEPAPATEPEAEDDE